MNTDQWARVKEVFHAALERGAEERMAFVASVCDADAALRAEVERLLAAHQQAGHFIERSPAAGYRPSLTGQALGHYQIGRLIGTGGMGEVYVARDVELGRDVALKIGIAGDADSGLRREAQHASQLNHPHICTIHEVGAYDGQTYIVMEYVEGQRLSDLIPPEGRPTESVVRYGIQIADALAHAHQHGVIHRDLKSANVVVTPEGRAKVLDFGLACGVSAERLGIFPNPKCRRPPKGLWRVRSPTWHPSCCVEDKPTRAAISGRWASSCTRWRALPGHLSVRPDSS